MSKYFLAALVFVVGCGGSGKEDDTSETSNTSSFASEANTTDCVFSFNRETGEAEELGLDNAETWEEVDVGYALEGKAGDVFIASCTGDVIYDASTTTVSTTTITNEDSNNRGD